MTVYFSDSKPSLFTANLYTDTNHMCLINNQFIVTKLVTMHSWTLLSFVFLGSVLANDLNNDQPNEQIDLKDKQEKNDDSIKLLLNKLLILINQSQYNNKVYLDEMKHILQELEDSADSVFPDFFLREVTKGLNKETMATKPINALQNVVNSIQESIDLCYSEDKKSKFSDILSDLN